MAGRRSASPPPSMIPDGDVTDYAWSATGGTIADDDAEATSWTAPAATDASVVYIITLTITDDQSGTGY